MIAGDAGDLSMARVRPWLGATRTEVMRALVPILSLGMTWWLSSTEMPHSVLVGCIVYGVLHIGLIALRYHERVAARITQSALLWLAFVCDMGFSLFLLNQTAVINLAIYPLVALIALRALAVYQAHPAAAITPFLLGPSYLFIVATTQPIVTASAQDVVWRAGLLGGSLSFGLAAMWLSTVRQQVNGVLRQHLRAEQRDRVARITDLERSANDLRARMRQLHTLEEGLRVITSTLSLHDVLNQIVDSTVQMIGVTRVQGMVLSLKHGYEFEHRISMLDENGELGWVTLLAQRVVEQEVPFIISDSHNDTTLAGMLPMQLRSVLCVPLFVGDEQPHGALMVISTTPAAFSSSDSRHLTALAMQAGIAIHNAEMHSQLRRQQQLLKAVVRDINDGLVVIDKQSQIVLANPIGRGLLDDVNNAQQIQSQLFALAASLRTGDMSQLTCELRLQQEDGESLLIYQAFGSQVRLGDGDEPLVAIVLHDITEQKAEEQSRTEFISMVAHELRNPLNSLNGFVKIVLRGQAGTLTSLQQEFLEIADSQVEQLKGRISELLEYNRVESGHLLLDPKWHDMSLLIAGAATRLSLQAKQNGLSLVNEVDGNLPECWFDGERIGQVLNNLVENAIKATPPGGVITLRSEVYENEVWVRVYDTGVGIPADEQGKIFQRFYRAHNRASSTGNHLGLGLTICQQIIIGHHGRLWVESEEGRGSCFTFALPLAKRTQTVNEPQVSA